MTDDLKTDPCCCCCCSRDASVLRCDGDQVPTNAGQSLPSHLPGSAPFPPFLSSSSAFLFSLPLRSFLPFLSTRCLPPTSYQASHLLLRSPPPGILCRHLSFHTRCYSTRTGHPLKYAPLVCTDDHSCDSHTHGGAVALTSVPCALCRRALRRRTRRSSASWSCSSWRMSTAQMTCSIGVLGRSSGE